MYAVLKPIYPDIRKEVSEDSGVGTVRADLKIPCLEVSIEAKCTRENMSLKKLTEEIEADIVHYKDSNYCFLFMTGKNNSKTNKIMRTILIMSSMEKKLK